MASNKAFVHDEFSEKKSLLQPENTYSDLDSEDESPEMEEERWILKLEEISLEILIQLKEHCKKRGLMICDKLKVTHIEDFLVRAVE